MTIIRICMTFLQANALMDERMNVKRNRNVIDSGCQLRMLSDDFFLLSNFPVFIQAVHVFQ